MKNFYDLHVLLASDENYISFLGANIYSLIKNSGFSRAINITVIHRNIDYINRSYIEKMVIFPHKISWIEVSESLCDEFSIPLAFCKMPANYFRLLAPFIFNENRIIYLDTDTIVTGDITPLMTLPLEGQIVGAVQDWLPEIKDAVINWRQLGVDGEIPYFNSGVLVIDLKKWRNEKISEQTLRICSENKEYLVVDNKWCQHEQYGLNVAINGKWFQLSSIWNHFTELPGNIDEIKILHFVGQGKPGSGKCLRQFDDIFNSILSSAFKIEI